jgi:hypothetical protein
METLTEQTEVNTEVVKITVSPWIAGEWPVNIHYPGKFGGMKFNTAVNGRMVLRCTLSQRNLRRLGW